MIGAVPALPVIGCALFIHYDAIRAVHDLRGRDNRLVDVGAGALAYTLGLRHAFDADPISAIDDTTRYLLQKGRKPLAVGFFFSLGHSTVVLTFVTALALVASRATWLQETFQGVGGVIATLVSDCSSTWSQH
jgi:nickel/cobalt transporter (NiCoT) family protein